MVSMPFSLKIFLLVICCGLAALYLVKRHSIVEAHTALWQEAALNLPWFKKWDTVLDWKAPYAHWFKGGQLNASYACLDTHIRSGNGGKVALVWQSEDGERKELTYDQLYDEVNRFASVLQSLGVRKGERVVVYMPMIPETFAALLAIARLGAVHVVVFSGFSSIALKERIVDTQARYIITADYNVRRGKKVSLKTIVDQALIPDMSGHTVEKVLIVQRFKERVKLVANRDVVYSDVRPTSRVFVEPVSVESNHPLFILYTSGTTGKPKGIMHSTGGYLTYCYATFKWVFQPKKDSKYWCTADIGWITGHSYVLYAPLMHGITSFIFEGAPDWPDPGVWWRLIEEQKVTIFYTSPTALRMAIKAGDAWPARYNLSSLEILGTVGEPINPEVWTWYKHVIGRDICPVVDTWWQTETGGFMIAPIPGRTALKPGSATTPLPGIEAAVVDREGKPVPALTKGYLIITSLWPGMAIGMYGDPKRFEETYWSKFKLPNGQQAYNTNDYAVKDRDGYYWLLGRADEVLTLSGHCVGTAEIESAVLTHPEVAEAATIGIAEPIRGEAAVLFVVLKHGYMPRPGLADEITNVVTRTIGVFVKPSAVYFVQKLPKTRSGKIMRRLLKNTLEDVSIGDISTLEDESSLGEIQEQYNTVKEALSQQQGSIH